MKYYDLSIPLQSGIPFWPGDQAPRFDQYMRIADGERVNCTRLHCSVHTGTHVDAPCHVIDDGTSVDQMPLEILIGPATVIELPGVDQIDAATLAAIQWPGTPRVLFKTINSAYWKQPVHTFRESFVSLTADGAAFLLEKEIQLVGVDYLSIDRFENSSLDVHQTLLGNGVIAIEGLNLQDVPAGSYELICLPLCIVGADGAPARVVLRSDA